MIRTGALRLAAMAAAGLLLGSCADGGEIARTLGLEPTLYERMTDADVAQAAQTMQDALENARNGETRPWSNAESGNAGGITPTRTFVTDAGVFCRDYRETLTIGGDSAERVNTACRNDDGKWVWVE